MYNLFSADGRTTPNQFWQGIILLVGTQIILYLGTAYISLWLMFLFFPLIYPYVCVYAKRLHDSGKTGWLFLTFFVGWMVVSMFMNIVLAGFSNIDAVAVDQELQLLGEDGDIDAILALLKEVIQADLLLSLVGVMAGNAIVGFPCASLRSDPHDNQYGPVIGGNASDGFQPPNDDTYN